VKTIFVIIVSILLISACSSKPTKKADVDTSKSTADNFADPISYKKYRQWRKDNDPASEAYAYYKNWIIKYREWKLEQESQ
jgi:hypothetical protein